jgi:outer membrane immunogenic protein
MYRKILLASVGAVALSGSAALAADLPSRAPPPPVYLPPAPIFTWTGIYIGGQVGYAWADTHEQVRGFAGFTGVGPIFFDDALGGSPNGVIGGAHVGYNYQIPGWSWFSSSGIVIGLEGSVDGTSMSRTVIAPDIGLTARTRAEVQGSIRGRVGFAWDRVLIYGTGGVAFGGFRTDFSIPLFGSNDFSTTRVGWTAGGGIEYALTNYWSIRAEYRYTDFGRVTDALFSSELAAVPGTSATERRHFTQNQVQAGVSYKFDLFAPAPIVAKY